MEKNAFREFIESLTELDSFPVYPPKASLRSLEIAANLMARFDIPNTQETQELFSYVIDRADEIAASVTEATMANYFNILLIWTAQSQPDQSKKVWYAFLLGVIFQELFGEYDEPPI